MNRRAFLTSLTAVGLVLAAPVLAQTAQDQIVRQLQRQGYRRIRIQRTWLGRVRITARGPEGTREIVLNPSSGAILRDYIDRDDDSSSDRFDRGSDGGSDGGSDNGDDNGGDDGDDDDDDSGPGGGDDDHGGDSGDDDDDD